MDTYHPMNRLLCREDLDHFRLHPAYTRRRERLYRFHRYIVFRGYLDALQSEFETSVRNLKAVLVNSPNDRTDLTLAIIRHSLQFHKNLYRLRVRAFLYRAGLSTSSAWEIEKTVHMLFMATASQPA